MKLKLNAEPKDWAMFGGFCVILLYVVCVAVLNIIQFAKGDLDHLFYGLNPFPALGSDYIGITLPCYIIALGASIFSVKDRFFDRDKGIGFGTDVKKESKGYSRWMKDTELKKELAKVDVKAEKADAGGLPLINDGKFMWVDNSEAHTLIIGSTGAGKTQVAIFPLVHSLAKHDESMIITDPKGEIYETTANMLKARGYNVILLNFRNPQQGSGWNPLHLPYKYYKEGNIDKANELTDDLAANILYDEAGQNNDPFWQNTSANYFSGICLGLFEDAKPEEINLNSINLFTTVGEEKCGARSVYANEYFKLTKDPASSAYVSASSTISAPSETRGSIISVFQQKIRLFAARDNLSEMLSHSDFEFEDIGRKKTAVFIVIQDEKKTYHSLVTIFLKQCYETLVDYAQKCGGKLPYRTNFLLDEFANMPPLKDVDAMVSAARSRKMRFFFVIQNFAQLSEVYGKEKGDTIKGNCTNIVYLISTELAALEEISKMCGEVKVKTDKKDKDGKAIEETRPLITISDLQKLKVGEIILLRTRCDPFRTKLKLDYQIDWGESYENAAYPTREKQKVQVFDLKKFVDEKKKEHDQEQINQMISRMTQESGRNSNPMPEPPKSSLDFGAILKSMDEKIAQAEAQKKAREGQTVGKIDPIKMPVSKPASEVKEVIKPGAVKQPTENTRKENIAVKPVEVVPSRDKKVQDFAARITNNVNKEIKHEIVNNKSKNDEVNVLKSDDISKAEVKDIFKNNKDENKTSNVNPVVQNIKENEDKKSGANNRRDYVTDDQFFDDFFADEDE